jgi:hypothetical protein
MRLLLSRKSALAAALGIFVLIFGIWYFWPQAYFTVRQADRLTVYEGLPHPRYEEAVFELELRTKPTTKLSGFPFYREPLNLKTDDVAELRSLLGASGTYQSHIDGKECGGFHPDYAVEWSSEGKIYRCLICFGCSEARFDGPEGRSTFYDLRSEGHGRDQKMRLLELLRTYRKNRPPHDRFGAGPLAVLLNARALFVRFV